MPALGGTGGREESRLATRLTRLRSLHRQGKLPAAASELLVDAIPRWTEGRSLNSDRLWQARADEFVAWVNEHGRTPHWSAGDAPERALAGWAKTQRTHALHGRHPARVKELDARLPIWRDSPSSSPKTLDGLSK